MFMRDILDALKKKVWSRSRCSKSYNTNIPR
jgi:hypothetical protein